MNRNNNLESCSRVGIFVDVQNMFYAARNLHEMKIDYGKLLDFLANGRDVIIAKAYIMTKEGVDNKAFEDALFKNGYDVERKVAEYSKHVKDRNDKERKVNSLSWNVGMTVDMISWSSKLDTIILVSGNGIFVDCIKYLKNFCRVEIAGFGKRTNSAFKQYQDQFIEIGPRDSDNSVGVMMLEN